jgi:uncharacterized Zn-finger protein
MEATPAAQPEKRVYVCKADGCGKCFHRGEHLKRHIRSIHTHEKRMSKVSLTIDHGLTQIHSVQVLIPLMRKILQPP